MEQGKSVDDAHAFTVDTKAAAEQLEMSEREVMWLSRSGRLLFKFEDGKYQTMPDDIDQERARRSREQDGS
jgi:hypothetical protein